MRDVRIILADPDGCTLGKTIPVSGTVPKDISIFTVQREDQDEDIINYVALPLVGDSYCCCTAVSSSGINIRAEVIRAPQCRPPQECKRRSSKL